MCDLQFSNKLRDPPEKITPWLTNNTSNPRGLPVSKLEHVLPSHCWPIPGTWQNMGKTFIFPGSWTLFVWILAPLDNFTSPFMLLFRFYSKTWNTQLVKNNREFTNRLAQHQTITNIFRKHWVFGSKGRQVLPPSGNFGLSQDGIMLVILPAVSHIQHRVKLLWGREHHCSFSQIAISFGNPQFTYFTHVKNGTVGPRNNIIQLFLNKRFRTLRLFQMKMSTQRYLMPIKLTTKC